MTLGFTNERLYGWRRDEAYEYLVWTAGKLLAAQGASRTWDEIDLWTREHERAWWTWKFLEVDARESERTASLRAKRDLAAAEELWDVDA